MRGRKWPVVVLVVTAGLVAAGWYGIRHTRASIAYGVRAEFDTRPATDAEFEAWMSSQPGVVRATVERKGSTVGVNWIMTQTVGSRQPPVPDYKAAFDRFGYKGLTRIEYDSRGL